MQKLVLATLSAISFAALAVASVIAVNSGYVAAQSNVSPEPNAIAHAKTTCMAGYEYDSASKMCVKEQRGSF